MWGDDRSSRFRKEHSKEDFIALFESLQEECEILEKNPIQEMAKRYNVRTSIIVAAMRYWRITRRGARRERRESLPERREED